MIKKILEWIFCISLIIAFLGWLFLGVTEIYVVSVTIATIVGLFYFFKYFPIKEVLKKEED